jgi:hypothetical protein
MRILLRINDDWALTADGLQWVLQRRRKGAQGWRPVSFVSTTKAVLARCLRERGVPADDAQRALDCLPDTFQKWAESHYGLVTGDKSPALVPEALPDEIDAVTAEAAL